MRPVRGRPTHTPTRRAKRPHNARTPPPWAVYFGPAQPAGPTPARADSETGENLIANCWKPDVSSMHHRPMRILVILVLVGLLYTAYNVAVAVGA